MINKPGVMAKVLGEFAEKKINIIAMTVMDSAEQAVMRVVFGAPDKARQILDKLNLPYSETNVINMTLNNESGALATVAEKLGKNHINIIYAYCTAGARGGRTTGILKVANVEKAMKILEHSEKKKNKSRPVVRKAKSTKR
ncbi:MAG: ACT domain-containing protein [Sedimentisphaerales bacterium]|nr:ACT domain-containing protein [Sedimentisphaerales bacterium]